MHRTFLNSRPSNVTTGCPAPVESASQSDLLPELQRGLTFILRRRLRAEDVDDAVHHVLKVTLPQIRERNIREKAAMLQFVRTIAVRYAGTFYARYAAEAQRRTLLARERHSGDLVRAVLDGLDERTREILHRYYVQEQSAEHISADMDLPVQKVHAERSTAKEAIGKLFEDAYTLRNRSMSAKAAKVVVDVTSDLHVAC
jgi:DNA-directed RNA polymerase specialized sigma24 family protein